MKWKKELEALVEETRAFVKSVKGDIPETATPVAPPPEEAAGSPVDPPRHVVADSPRNPPPPQPSMLLQDERRLPPPLVTGSERGDMERHIEGYRALLRKRIRDKDAFQEHEMNRIRAMLKTPPKSG
jgi:hypothetical protein